MKQSTAKFVPYGLRPAKQAERRILLDFLKCATDAGISLSGARYVGMGGTMFYDFHLIHRFLGVRNMISLERDDQTYPRSAFNCPFDFIRVEQRTVADFLSSDSDKTRTIYWLDYDDGIGPEIIADIMSLGAKMHTGGFVFVTTSGPPPGAMFNQTTTQRLEYFQDELPAFSTGLTIFDMENAQFPATVHRILVAAIKNAFAGRSDGVCEPTFQIQYRDTSPMITVGGCFCAPPLAKAFRSRLKTDLPFLISPDLYSIRRLNLTDRERLLFDMAVTRRRKNSKEMNFLKKLGFKKGDFDAYRDLLRFLPRYHESII